MDKDKPLLLEKSRRGREMKTKEMRLSKDDEKKLYHEGYVDGKKYLVPDSNLEAMKEIVTYKMKRKGDHRYAKGSMDEDKHKEYEKYQKKLQSVFDKLTELEEVESELIEHNKKHKKDSSDESSSLSLSHSETISKTSSESGGKNPPPATSESLTEKTSLKNRKQGSTIESNETGISLTEKKPLNTRKQGSTIESNETGISLTEKKPLKTRKQGSTIESNETGISLTEKTPLKTRKQGSTIEFNETGISLTEKTPLKTRKQGSTIESNETGISLTEKTPLKTRKQGSTIKSNETGISKKTATRGFETLRFLVSGHFRSDAKPIFIIQQYEGKSPFENKSPDFASSQTESNVDIIMSGKFYQESILEEVDHVPTGLRIKPNKIVIDERSRLYEESFNDVVNVGDLDVEFGGKFIQQGPSQLYTPLISVGVKKAMGSALNPEKHDSLKNKTAMVYVSTPVSRSPYEKGTKNYDFKKETSFSLKCRPNDDYDGLNLYPSTSRKRDSADIYKVHLTPQNTINPNERRSSINHKSGQNITENGELSNKSGPVKKSASSLGSNRRKSGYLGQATVRKISQAFSSK